MADENQSSRYRLERAVGSNLPARETLDLSSLSDTMAESLRWTKSTLPGIETLSSGANDDTALQEARLQIARLQQTLIEFEAEHARLAAEYQKELGVRSAELSNLQAAYEQFQEQSDLLLNELDQQNERLRGECRASNPRSVL